MKPSLLVVGIGVATTALIGYNLIHKPQQRQLRLVRAQITAEQTRQQAATTVAALLHDIEQYRKQLPEEPDASWLAQEAVTLAEQSGVQLTTISQEPPQRFDAFTRLAVKLQVTASYHQLGAFLDQLERSNHFIRVDRVEIPPGRDASHQTQDMNVTLSTLYVPSGLKGLGGTGSGG